MAVERHRRRMQQPRQAPALDLALSLLEAVLGQDDGRWVDDHDTGITVDHHPIILTYQLAGQPRADHRGYAQTARDDRGM